jgi:opacity protein-like surface antigen
MEMNLTNRLAAIAFAALAMASASAADRVRAGQWETTMGEGARAHVMKACVGAADAAALNGDERTLRAALEKTLVDTGCTVKSLKLSGNVVVADNLCGGKAFTSTTTYHGDHYEQTSTLGSKVSARRVGDCKP